MKKLLYTFFFLVFVFFTGCSDANKAKSLAVKFLDENIQEDYSVTRVMRFDSTNYVSKQQVDLMRSQMKTEKAFKKDMRYVDYDGGKLYYIRLQLRQKTHDGNNKRFLTFYVDTNYVGVVSFKNQ